MGKQKWRCTLCDLLCSLLKRKAKCMPARFQLTVDVLLISELDDQVWGPRSEVCKGGTPERAGTEWRQMHLCDWEVGVSSGVLSSGEKVGKSCKLENLKRQSGKKFIIVNKLEEEKREWAETPDLTQHDSKIMRDCGQKRSKRLTSEKNELKKNWLGQDK